MLIIAFVHLTVSCKLTGFCPQILLLWMLVGHTVVIVYSFNTSTCMHLIYGNL